MIFQRGEEHDFNPRPLHPDPMRPSETLFGLPAGNDGRNISPP
jgi:hypothetical protein